MCMKLFTTKKKSEIDEEIHSVLCNMSTYAPDSDEYTKMTKNLEMLYKAKSYEKDRRVSKDTVLVVAGNLLGIAIILGYEKANVITSKALGFVLKGRV